MADQLEFGFMDPHGKEKWADHFGAGIAKVTQIFLNGKELVAILREMEYPFAEKENKPDLAGAYGHLPPSELLGNLVYAKEHPDDEAELLCCDGCGESGCWSILVKVRYEDGFVYWEQFQHNHRDWAYPLSFQFDALQYEKQLQLLSENGSIKNEGAL